MLLANKLGLLDQVDITKIKKYEDELLSEMRLVHKDLLKQIEDKKEIDNELYERLSSLLTTFTTKFNLEGI